MTRKLVLVLLGGGLGSVARYLAALASARWVATTFPVATLAVNVLGSFLLTAGVQAWPEHQGFAPELKLFLGTGLLGGFTTYSTFNAEVVSLAEQGAWGKAAGYLVLSNVACLVAGAAGWVFGRTLSAR